jgi:hypothetical protein
MRGVPICVECRHCVATLQLGRECWRRVAKAFDPVTGATDQLLLRPCRNERAAYSLSERLRGDATRCGPDGQFFERKDEPDE